LHFIDEIQFLSGYIPQRKYQLGNRYRVEANVCLAGTKASYDQSKTQAKELRRIIASYPKTQSVNNDTVVKHFLDYHRAYNPTEGSQQSREREEKAVLIFISLKSSR
jgi:hypothetical protein